MLDSQKLSVERLLEHFDREQYAYLKKRLTQSVSFRELVSYHMAWLPSEPECPQPSSGKKIRPLLTLLVAQTLSGNYRAAMPAALAVEIVHDFSLIMDDIMDRDELRRHRPTLWVKCGVNKAMTVATGLYVLGLDAIQDYIGSDLPAARVRHVSSTLIRYSLEMHDAQLRDLDWECGFDMDLEAVTAVARGRSALIQCGAEIGAVTSCADPLVWAAFGAFGALLATTYSIYDDYRGLWGSAQENGKPVLSDIRQRKKTYPIVAGYLLGGATAQRRIRNLFAQPSLSVDETLEVLRLLEDAGAQHATLEAVERLRLATIDSLANAALAGLDTGDLAAMSNRLAGVEPETARSRQARAAA